MKNNIITNLGRVISLQVVAAAIMAFVFISCQKDDSFVSEEVFKTGDVSAINEMGLQESSDLKRGNGAPAPGSSSIAEIASAAGFTELVGALEYVDEELDAGLVNLFLNGTDQFTVFAPTNEAFDALYGALEIDGITDLPAEVVLDVLFYHVVKGRRAANSVVPPVRQRQIMTLLGQTFTVTAAGKILAAGGNEANIETPNISASNGIIHIIDAVILPAL